LSTIIQNVFVIIFVVVDEKTLVIPMLSCKTYQNQFTHNQVLWVREKVTSWSWVQDACVQLSNKTQNMPEF